MKIFIVFLILIISSSAFAWERRGHEIIASVAARIVEEKIKADYLMGHEFDLGYYTNVPDIIFKKLPKSIVAVEAPLHFLDWDADLKSVFKTPQDIPKDFATYKKMMGEKYRVFLGTTPWRISGLFKRCKGIASDLKLEKQGPLLVCIGILSHYTGDLSMPLHTSANHDGQKTNQQGIHAFFEKTMVDELDPQLKVDVMNEALKKYKDSEYFKVDSDVAVRAMILDSSNHVDELLKIDKENNRKDLNASKEKFRKLITDRLVQGAILTAALWTEILSPVHHFNDDHFYFFDGKPAYINPELE